MFGQRDGGLVEGQESHRAVAVVRAVEAHRVTTVRREPVRALVEAVAAPGVVRLPGGVVVEDHHRAGRVRRPDRDRDVPLGPAGRVQAQQVRTGRPIRGGNRHRRPPRGRHHVGARRDVCRGLLLPADPSRRPHQARLMAGVPAEAERVHPERLRRGRHVQAEALAGQHALLIRVPVDRVGRPEVGDPPGRCARPLVLRHREWRRFCRHDRRHRGNRTGGGRPGAPAARRRQQRHREGRTDADGVTPPHPLHHDQAHGTPSWHHRAANEARRPAFAEPH